MTAAPAQMTLDGAPTEGAPVFVESVQKNSTEEFRFSLEMYRGHLLANMRVWYRDENGEMKPGRAGVACKLEKLPLVIAALQHTLTEAQRRGLVR